MIRLAIIDHSAHRLYVEDAPERLIELAGGEQEYIDDNYTFEGEYSWDYIVDAEYIPEDSGDPIEIDFDLQ